MIAKDQHWPGDFRHCPFCGARVARRCVAGKMRAVCTSCDVVHYRNPGVGAAVVVWNEKGQLLLVQRAPRTTRAGFWCIPCGYVDYGEDVRAAAARELKEETGLEASIGEPVHVASNFHDPAKLTVGIWFAGTITGGQLRPGDDAADARFFDLDELPPLAFDTDRAFLAGLPQRQGGEV